MIDYFALATAITREYRDLLGIRKTEPCEYNHSLNPTAEDGVECGKGGTYREDLEIVLCDRHYREMK